MLLAEIERSTSDWERGYRARQALEAALAAKTAECRRLEHENTLLRQLLVKVGEIEEGD